MERYCRIGVVGAFALIVGATLWVGAPAEAQLDSSFYVVTNAPGSYSPLGASGSTVKKVTGTDQGAFDLSLSGWTFPYFDQNYKDIWITADGFLSMHDSTNSSHECTCTNSNGSCEAFERYCGEAGENCGGGCCIQANGTCAANNNQDCGNNYYGCCGGYNGGYACIPIREYVGYDGPPTSNFPMKIGGVIAPYWKGLDDVPNKAIRYLVGGATGSHTLTVDYPGVWDSMGEYEYPYVGGQYTFSVTLFESGMIEVDYGAGKAVYSSQYPKGQANEYYEAWAMISSPDQSTIINGLSCMVDSNWYNEGNGYQYCEADYRVGCGCTPERFPVNQTIFYGQPAGVAFFPQIVTASNGLEDPLNKILTFDVTTSALNVGLSDVNTAFADNLYLENGLKTTDNLDATCAALGAPGCVYTGTQNTVISAAPAPATSLGVKHVSMALPADGIYTLEEWFDPTNSTSNGLAGKVGSTVLEVGWDLTGSIGVDPPGIPGPTGPCYLSGRMGTGPGQNIPITFQNLGSRLAPNTTYRLWASKTNTLPFDASASSPNVSFSPDGTVDLGGFDTHGPVCLPVTVPSVAEGDYYLVLQMDPDGAYPADVNPANNIVFTKQTVHISPPHLRVSDVVGPAQAYQGRPTDIGFTLASDGASDANGFSVGLMLVPQGGSLTTTSYKTAQFDGVSLKAGCTIQVRHGAVVFSSSDGCYVWPSGAVAEVVPPNAADSRKTPAGLYNAGVIADITNLVLPRLGRDTNHLEAPTTTTVQLPLPDFSILAGDINAPTSALAGSEVLVERNIRNIGVASATATYGYFLNLNGSPNVLEVNQGGIPIPVVLPTGELTYSPTVALDYPGDGQSEDRGADLLVIPSTLSPPAGAMYTLALVLDPMNQVIELDKSNNAAGVGPIAVTRTDLAIGSTNPPSGLPEVPYSFAFSATGGFGAYSWSILAGALPAGLTLTPDGVLSGTPTILGTWTLLVEVSSGGQTQVASVTFTVAPPSGPLQLIKSGLELPPATVGEVYAAQLAAQGGTPPYSWSATESSLPDGLNLSPSGLLSGTPTPKALTTKGAAVVAVTVTDQAGNTKFDTYLLEIVGPGDLVITTTDIPPQQVNQPWLIDLSASGCKGTDPTSPWCHWTIPAGQILPAGLQLATQGKGANSVGHLSGTLTESGIWFFEVQVTDDNAHLATRHYRLQVGGSVLTLPGQTLDAATAGQPYSAQLTGPSGVTVTWLLYSGNLPPGLTLASDGSISGTVAANAGIRTYAFTVSALDSQGNESLLAQAITVQQPKVAAKSGCSTGGGGLMPFGVLGLGLLLTRRRKTPAAAVRTAVRAVAIAAALSPLLIAGSARAQTGGGGVTNTLGGYYQVAGNPERWVDLTDPANALNATILYQIPTAYASYNQTISLPFANPFTYNGNSYSTLSVASNGFASFTSIGSNYCSSGSCYPSTTILAPWWGGMGVCYDNASVSWATSGAEPNLSVIVQWSNISYDHSGTNDCSGTDIGRDRFSFQLVLHESGVVDFVYGDNITASGTINCTNNYSSNGVQWCLPNDFPPPPCAMPYGYCEIYSYNSCLFASGLEDDTGNTQTGIAGLQCGASCSHNVFPLSGTVSRFTSGPDLQIGVVDVLGQFSPGLAMTATVQVANVASNPLASASSGVETIELYLSPDGVQQGLYLGTTAALPILVPGAAPNTVEATVTLPADAPVGQVQYLIAVLHEPAGNGDVDPVGKIGASNPLVVAQPLPDLLAGPLNSAGSGSPGNAILLVPSISNRGNADAPAGVPYAYYLAPSTAESVSPTDLQIGIAATLPALEVGTQAPTVQDTVDLPPWLPAGTYAVGLIIDPGNTTSELSKQNNGVLSTTLLVVTDNGLNIATSSVPYGYLGGPYQAQLIADHGRAPYQWSLVDMPDNPMPPGLTLSTTGQITGTPSAVFNARVVFKVVDSSTQQETATKPLVFNNVATQLPLTVVTQQLPTGGFNSQYLVQLIAIGGQWPYQWSTVTGGGLLPPGMALGADGTLTGVPTQAGQFSFSVQVSDSSQPPVVAKSSRFNLQIAAPGLVTLAASQLPVGVVGQPYVGVLRAAGGSNKYEWTLINDLQLPDGPGTTSKNWNNVEPPGFNKININGTVNGEPSQAGLFALSVQAQEVLSDGSHGASATDTVLLRVVPADGLYIKNSSLPDATVGLPYSAKLETNAVSSVGSVFFQPVDGSGQDTSAARASIPAGLTLNQDGTLSGTPRATGRYLFLVQAIDQAENRSTIAALSLSVADTVATASGSGGCATSGGASALSPLLLALLGFAELRRGRERRSPSPT